MTNIYSSVETVYHILIWYAAQTMLLLLWCYLYVTELSYTISHYNLKKCLDGFYKHMFPKL